MSGKKGMKHYPLAVKLAAVRMYHEEGKSQQEITELLEIRDRGRVKKWLRAYRQDGTQAFQAGRSADGRQSQSRRTRRPILPGWRWRTTC